MSLTCEICKKTFKYHYLLHRHQKKTNPCKPPIHVQVNVEKKVEKLQEELEKQHGKVEELEEELNKQNEKIEQIQLCKEIKTKECYRCRFCLKSFSSDSNLTRHLNQKSCKFKNDNVAIYERELGIEPPEVPPLTCRFCNVKYSKQQSYSRHMLSDCKEKLKYENELQRKVLSNRKEVAEAKVSINGSNNHTNSHNTVNNNNNNIYLPPMNAFGNENVDYITTKMLLKQIELCKDFTHITETVKTFTQLIHAHPAHPENHNVLLKGNNTAFAEIYNGENMEQANALVVEDQILQKVGRLLLDRKQEYYDEAEKKDKNVPKKVEKKLEDLEGAVEDNINTELDRDTVSDTTRNLNTYRNIVKGVLISKKEDIQQTQKINI